MSGQLGGRCYCFCSAVLLLLLLCQVGAVNNTFGTPGVEEHCLFLKVRCVCGGGGAWEAYMGERCHACCHSARLLTHHVMP